MSYQIPTIEPSAVTAGDTIQFKIALPDYPASDGWVLKYTLAGNAGTPITWTSSASGDDHLINVPAATSAPFPAGLYTATKYVVKSATGERYTLGQLSVQVKPDLAAATGATDTRSHAKRVLEAIEAVIEGRASKGDQELTIDGTRLVKMTVEQLLSLRSRYLKEYKSEQQAERLAKGLGTGRKVLVRFNS